jgi:GNAT superfamily N-acetyltransferase
VIRACDSRDAETLVNLVRELAVYERLEAFVKATPDRFRTHLFGSRPVAEAILAEVAGDAIGFAVFFPTFSTFRGQPGLYLEDLFVRPDHRGKGIGRSLLATVARRAVECGCGQVNWIVLEWNKPAIGFYRAAGAEPIEEWLGYRIAGEPLVSLAASAP